MRKYKILFALGMFLLSLVLLQACADDDQNLDPQPDPIAYFPVLEVSGSHYEIGYAIGETFKFQISEAFNRTADMMGFVEAFIAQDSALLYAPFVDVVEQNYPQFMEELRGMSDASGIAFEKFMVFSCISEYIAIIGNSKLKSFIGCSSLSYKANGQLFLAHNEDGQGIFYDLMFVLKAHPEGKPSFISFCYPGMIPCVAPAMNDAGIFYSGNYINGKEVLVGGMPNSFIQRSLMEAHTMDEALNMALINNRASCCHLNLASKSDQQIMSIELSPSKSYVYELEDGFFVHTNHFIQPGMTDLCSADSNSISRFVVLDSLCAACIPSEAIDGELLTDFLSSHAHAPNAPCAHGFSNGITGQTLGSTLFDINKNSWRISYNNPCEKKFQYLEL